MAIVENKASEIGDIILIRAEVPIIGLITLASFTDSVVNETGTRYFEKSFRYAVDGLNFSPWVPLTLENIDAVEVAPKDAFLIEYRYVRVGSDATGELEFNQVEVTGEFAESICGDNYKNSIFAQFFSCTDVAVLSWMINVLEKLYKKGILPNYIERGDQNNDKKQDQDFLEFWKSITQYFAYIVVYARQWELSNSTVNSDILIEYLQNQMFLFTGSESVAELSYVMNHTYDEARKRGTFEIIRTKEGDGKSIDGEWHRLFNNISEGTDWYFSSMFNYKVGWVCDSCSPLYRGTLFDQNMIKGFEPTKAVVDLDEYPKIGSSITIVTDTDNEGVDVDTMSVIAAASETQGIGHTGSTVAVNELIKVAPNAEYEITFWVKVETVDGKLTLAVDCFDINGNKLAPVATSGAFYNGIQDYFFQNIQLPRNDKYYFVRGIIYGNEHKVSPNELFQGYLPNIVSMNIPTGTNSWINSQQLQYNGVLGTLIKGYAGGAEQLKFRGSSMAYISPRITVTNTGATDTVMKLFDVKVRPLRTHYGTGFVQPSNFIKMQVKNSNLNYSNKKTEELMREYLIPYNSTYKMSFLNPPIETNIDNVTDIISSSDSRFTNPTATGVGNGDRYLVFEDGSMTLYSYSPFLDQWQEVDNVQGNIAYVVNKRTVYSYDDSVWKFKAN